MLEEEWKRFSEAMARWEGGKSSVTSQCAGATHAWKTTAQAGGQEQDLDQVQMEKYLVQN